jgi:DNA modification methylase
LLTQYREKYMNKEIRSLKVLLNDMKDIEGFPKGEDEDILELSDPPYYTACPNPYIKDFIAKFGEPYNEETDTYHREPFIDDISEGKGHPIYNAHTYHTKVPHKAIIRFLTHYSEEGDVIFDPFCGTGMTGVAAQNTDRKAVLSDLSPIAGLLASIYNTPIDSSEFNRRTATILNEVIEEYAWVYQTKHDDNNFGNFNYIVWSDVLISPFSNQEFIFFDAALDKETNKVNKEFLCPHTDAKLTKKMCKKSFVQLYDNALGKDIEQIKQVPVLINYTYNGKTYEKSPDVLDIEIIGNINNLVCPNWYPTDRLPSGDESRRNDKTGLTHIHHFYSNRTLLVLSAIFNRCETNHEKGWFTSQLINLSKLNRYRPNVTFPYNPLSGTLYVSSLISEANVFTAYANKVKKFEKAFQSILSKNMVSTSCATNIGINDDTIDYIFTDPPFGANIMYSELSFMWEVWLKVKTNINTEAIINRTHNKGLKDYQKLMVDSFKECYRVLKPKRWITVEFHNSKSSVWNAIQDAMIKAGFIIAQVTVLDKQLKSFKQVTSAGSVKNDLVISAYKPKKEFENQFLSLAGEGLEIEFIKMHLNHLNPEPSIERTEQMLYSKMLAFYIQRNYSVKYNSKSFYKMLKNNFTEEDGFWFNKDQLNNYQEFKQKMKLENIDEIELGAFQLFVSDERSAIIWLYSFLDTPKTFQDIQPAFTKIAFIGDDQVPELSGILNNNFIKSEDFYRRPSSEDEKLDLTEKREKELMKEFDILLLEAKGSKRKIKQCRKQAVLQGFEHCYKNNRLEDILLLGKKLDKKILENSSELTDFIEIAEVNIEGF